MSNYACGLNCPDRILLINFIAAYVVLLCTCVSCWWVVVSKRRQLELLQNAALKFAPCLRTSATTTRKCAKTLLWRIFGVRSSPQHEKAPWNKSTTIGFQISTCINLRRLSLVLKIRFFVLLWNILCFFFIWLHMYDFVRLLYSLKLSPNVPIFFKYFYKQ